MEETSYIEVLLSSSHQTKQGPATPDTDTFGGVWPLIRRHTAQQNSNIFQRSLPHWYDVCWVGQGELFPQPLKVLVPSPHLVLGLGKAVGPWGLSREQANKRWSPIRPTCACMSYTYVCTYAQHCINCNMVCVHRSTEIYTKAAPNYCIYTG